ncbi:hypothetical protein [Nocardioides abyssi]|uniref:Uncharacterized protein n=1 Tax=Nocardioides abyssi TaxID=3058370 RepID=A0ABT8EQK9_9ACTN|nr:hypothetical protein [Nocardioides abyssi]MDN4160432.1 hypothetical protein [Nocardioides abyssi]
MYLADLGASYGAVAGAAKDVVFDPQSAADVIALLDETIGEIRADRVRTVGPTSFGTLPSATSLAHHTQLARDAIVDSLIDLRAGLQVYADNVNAYRQDIYGTDEAVMTENIAPLQAGIDCTSGNVPAQNDPTAAQCTVPGGSDA